MSEKPSAHDTESVANPFDAKGIGRLFRETMQGDFPKQIGPYKTPRPKSSCSKRRKSPRCASGCKARAG